MTSELNVMQLLDDVLRLTNKCLHIFIVEGFESLLVATVPAWFNPTRAGEVHNFLEKITHVNFLTAPPVVD